MNFQSSYSEKERIGVFLVEDDPEDAAIFRHYAKRVSTYLLDVDHEEATEHIDAYLNSKDVDLVFLDQRLGSGITGLDVLKRIKRSRPYMPVIILTGTGDEKIAVEMMRNGAADYLTKETFNSEILRRSVRYALEQRKLAIRDARAQEALRQSELRYRTLFESAPVAVFIQNMDGVVSEANQTTLEMTGYSRNEINGIGIQDTYQDTADWKRLLKSVAETGFVRGFEIRLKHKNGTCYEARLNVTKLALGENELLFTIAEDMTDHNRLEARLFQSQRMESIGTLAGGIAHNFNNVLMGIQGRTSLMMMGKGSSHPDFQHLKGIEEHVQSAAELTKDLLGFARGGKYEVRPTNLNKLIEQENRMFGQTKREITIQNKCEHHLWTVEVDQGQMRQVLLNIYVNAWQAMPGGGTLFVETENVTLGADDVNPFSAEPGRYVKLSITDTGVGMDKATRERVFDPFFTTKETGSGTGLGLASAYGIIKNHGGFISVCSEPGSGTKFDIFLPASEQAVAEQKEFAGEAIKGCETVLFVDDEEMVTDVTQDLLEDLGYKVLIGTTGQEAVEIYNQNRDLIDLVILDMIMPGMSGGETYDRLKAIDPGVKVLLSSGYSVEGQASEILARGCNGFIQKPFSVKEISRNIRAILDNGSSVLTVGRKQPCGKGVHQQDTVERSEKDSLPQPG